MTPPRQRDLELPGQVLKPSFQAKFSRQVFKTDFEDIRHVWRPVFCGNFV
jgi:hypothetical protein